MIYAILKPIPNSTPLSPYHLRHHQTPGVIPKPMPVRAQDHQDPGARHLDSHYLSRDTIVGTKHRYYPSSNTRLAWAEVVGDIKSLSVMFAVLKSINFLNAGIQFEAILTDNGPEMASPRNTEGHPMEIQ